MSSNGTRLGVEFESGYVLKINVKSGWRTIKIVTRPKFVGLFRIASGWASGLFLKTLPAYHTFVTSLTASGMRWSNRMLLLFAKF